MKLLSALLDLLFPPKCCFCRKILDEPGVCPDCEALLPRTGEEAGQQLEKQLHCASPLWYEDPVREALLRFKFRGARWEAEILGALLADCADRAYGDGFDAVTWAPVSRKRRRERGYDQSQLLAESACRLWGRQPERLLKKVVHNPAQSGISDEAARRANVLGVYDAVNADKIRGRRILLVDDICTTGSTLRECARVLRGAGAADVMAVTVARTRKPSAKSAACGRNTQESGTKCR